MFQLTPEQFKALDDQVGDAFVQRTHLHLLAYFPHHCELLGKETMHQAIRWGWARARQHAFSAECCVRTYIEFMCLLGSGFDQDPLLPWAAGILNDRGTAQVDRGDLLYDRAWAYIRSIVPDYRDSLGQPTTDRFVVELRRLAHASDRPLDDGALPHFHDGLQSLLRSVFPTKCAVVGATALQDLARRASDAARRHGIHGERGTTLMGVLMFVCGAGADSDPLLPWMSEALRRRDLVGEKQRVDRLLMEGVGTLRRWWQISARPAAGLGA